MIDKPDPSKPAEEAIRLADMTGGVLLPALVALVYGLYLVFFGTDSVNSSVSIILIIGSLLTILTFSSYLSTISSEPKRSWIRAATAASVFIPYALSLYLMCFLGIYGIWLSFSHSLGFWAIVASLGWLLLGWRMLNVIGEAQRVLTYRSDD